MKASVKHLSRALIPAAKRWWAQGHADSAAALAFYSVFSLVPLLLISIQVASLAIDARLANKELEDNITYFAGPEVADYVSKLVDNNAEPLTFSLSSIVSIIIIFFTASRVVAKLRDTLNTIFGMPQQARKRAILFNTVFGRLISVALVGSMGGIIALSAVASITFESISKFLEDRFPGMPWAELQLGFLFKSIVAFFLVTALLSLTFRWLPRDPPKAKYAFAGAFVASLGFMALEKSLSLYFKFVTFGGAFSGAIALILLLFWIYFAMQIVLFGAEYSKELSVHHD